MKHLKRSVKAHLNQNGVVIFRLLQGQKKPRTVQMFGYGPTHNVWLRVDQVGPRSLAMSAENARTVKEQIAEWVK